jgi:crossover junction endodeoxyribonuclease RuvC
VNFKKIKDPMERMQQIFHATTSLIHRFAPAEMAIEAPFHGKNIQSMLKLGRAQGIAIAAALYHDLKVYEYAPRKVKQSITGKGSATKEQVAAILKNLLKINELPEYLDATDGLAVAVCHHFQNGMPELGDKKFGGWESFVAQNQERVR